MQKTKRLISGALVFLFAAFLACLSISHHPNGRDSGDLAQAIVNVRILVESAFQPSGFEQSFEKAVSQIACTAGLKIKLSAGNPLEKTKGLPWLFLVSFFSYGLYSIRSLLLAARAESYLSTLRKPEIPPPRRRLHYGY